MHQAVADFVSEQSRLYVRGPVRILDIGGRKTSMSGRYYSGPHPIDLFPQATEYLTLDITPGPDVDIVADATQSWTIPWERIGQVGVVVCTEVLEHVQDWVQVLATAHDALEPGGRLILTCAGIGRHPHPATTEDPDPPPGEFYANVSHMELRKALEWIGFRDIITYQIGLDTQASAVK